MRKFTMFFMSSLICLCGCFTACSGNSDDNGEEPDNGEVTGPITLTVDKAKIEANGTDMATFTVTDANGKVLTTSEYMKNVYFEDVTTGDYLERRTNTFSAVENGTHKFKAYYLDWESDEVSVTAQNRRNYELFYRKVGVFKMTGTWCTYCPAMTSALKKVEELMPGRMVKMAFHSSSSSATDPFHLSQTSTIMSRFGASGFPTCIYDLKVMSIDRNVSAIKQTLQSQIRQYPATCGIKVNTSYNSSMGEITVNAALKSSLGGEYDLVYVLVTDGLTASGGNEASYDYTVRAISNNYLSMSTDGRFTVSANEEHTAATFSISNAKNLNPATSRVVVYALRKVDDAYMVDNITECSINGSIDYLYND